MPRLLVAILMLALCTLCWPQDRIYQSGFDVPPSLGCSDMTQVRQNLAISIAPPAGGSDLKLKPSINLPVVKGSPIFGWLIGQGGTKPYIFSEVGSVFSAVGIIVNADGSITGTPTTIGHYSALVKVQDAASGVFRCTISINVLTPLFIVNATPTVGEVGQYYQYQIQIGGNTGDLRFTNTGDLPPGLFLGGWGTGGTPGFITTTSGAVTIVGSNYRVPLASGSGFVDNEWIVVGLSVNVIAGKIVSGGGTNTVDIDIASAVVTGTATSMAIGSSVYSDISGLLYGLPTTDGDYSAAVRATDLTTGDFIDFSIFTEIEPTGAVTFDNTVSPGPGGLGGTWLPPVILGIPYSATVQTSGAVAPFKFSDTNGVLTGLGFSINPKTGEVTGTITDQSLATGYSSPYLVEVIAYDALGAGLVTAQAALAITNPAVSTNAGLSENSDELIPSQAAVKSYVDAHSGGSATTANVGSSATLSATINRYTANNVVGTAPASPVDHQDIYVKIESAFTGCAFTANSGQTANGGSSFTFDITPCYFHFSFDDATNDWFVCEYRIGTI